MSNSYVDWILDDITWCVRECDNTSCFRNQKNRRLKSGLISVGDMFEKGRCPDTAKLPKKRRRK